MAHIRTLVLICLAAGCAGPAPTAPTAPPSPMATPPAPAASSAHLSGRVVDALHGRPALSDVVLTLAGVGDAHTGADGAFQFDVPDPGPEPYPLQLRRGGFVDRDTRAVVPAEDVTVGLIPASFDLDAFAEFAPRSAGLRRWTSNPTLLVEQSVIEFDTASAGFTDFIVDDRLLAGAGLDCVLRGVRDAIGPMTGGHLAFADVVVADPLPAGSHFRTTDTPEGTIVVVGARSLNANGRATGYAGADSNVFTRGAVFISTPELPLCSSTGDRTYPHELGHALGYAPNHVTRQPSIMGSPPTSTVSAFDEDAIAILYDRPPGNRAPDVDPDTSVAASVAGSFFSDPVP